MYLSILSIIIGYLIGSISPAYFLGKILRGIDMRNEGDPHLRTGATNTKHVLGMGPAVVVGAIDFSKGVLAILIANYLGAPIYIGYLAGFAAILGHILPFYLKFKGGQGMATAMGILIYFFYSLFGELAGLDLANFIYSGITIAILCLGIYYISRKGEMVGLFAIPYFIALLFLNLPATMLVWFLAILLLFMWGVQIYNVKVKNLLVIDSKYAPDLIRWRTLARPIAVVIPIMSFYLSAKILLYVIGSVALVFIIIDLVRLISSGANIFLFTKAKWFLKEKERKMFSSMTLFLTAVFILILIFPPEIAQTAILFLVFGDLGSKFFRIKYGRIPFFNKHLEGSLAYFIFSLAAGFILSFFLPIPFWLLLAGALTASIVEALSIFGIDDNFTVGLISASVMVALGRLI